MLFFFFFFVRMKISNFCCRNLENFICHLHFQGLFSNKSRPIYWKNIPRVQILHCWRILQVDRAREREAFRRKPFAEGNWISWEIPRSKCLRDEFLHHAGSISIIRTYSTLEISSSVSLSRPVKINTRRWVDVREYGINNNCCLSPQRRATFSRRIAN